MPEGGLHFYFSCPKDFVANEHSLHTACEIFPMRPHISNTLALEAEQLSHSKGTQTFGELQPRGKGLFNPFWSVQRRRVNVKYRKIGGANDTQPACSRGPPSSAIIAVLYRSI